MNKRLASKWNDSSTIRDHKASFIVRIDYETGEIDIDKDRYGARDFNISVSMLLKRLSAHVRDETQQDLLKQIADRLENIKCFM